MLKGKHLFLTGFMGSGKSTAGKKTAAHLQMPFVDLDVYIEERNGKTISRIFEEKGEEHFRRIEAECLSDLVKLKDEHVISLGGGTVCFHNNLELIKQHGILIYIQLPAKALAERLRQSKGKRPVLDAMSENDLLQNIESLLSQRKSFYEQADIIINGLNLNAALIESSLRDHLSKHSL